MSTNSEGAEKYLQFHMQKVEPKIEEIIATDNTKKRKKIQREIVSLIQEAGYIQEARRIKAIFNL